MSGLERVLHAVLFEVLAVSLLILGLILFTDHKPGSLSLAMIAVATIAMAWNFVYNAIVDQFATGPREERTFAFRIMHTVFFEIGLLTVTVPVIAYIVGLSLWDALLLDIGATIFVTIYATVYNYIYDHVRVLVIKRFMPAQ